MIRHNLKELFAILASMGWWLLQMIDNIDEKWKFFHFFFAHKICVGVILGIITIIVILYDSYKANVKKNKLHCLDVMKYITEKHFLTIDNSVRCTIFRPVGGKFLFCKLIWQLIIKRFCYNIIHSKFKATYKTIKDLVPDTSIEYLSIFLRFQHPHVFKSHIAFPINPGKNVYGSVTERCYKKGDVVEIHTINISEINLPQNEPDIRRGDKGKIKEYMDASYINDYSTLLKMNSVANHIIAVPIILEDETTWGIMTIDYIGGDNVLEMDERIADLLKSYSKMISINIKHQ